MVILRLFCFNRLLLQVDDYPTLLFYAANDKENPVISHKISHFC